MSRIWEIIPHSWEEMDYKEFNSELSYCENPNPRKFKTPGDLWAKAVKYFEWCASTPLLEQHATKMKVGDGVEEIEYYNMDKKRYMSKTSLCLFIGMDRRNFARKYESGEYGPAFKEVCEAISAVILDDQMTGAAAGLYNPMIVARHVGLLKDTQNDEGEETKAKSFEINFSVREPVEVEIEPKPE